MKRLIVMLVGLALGYGGACTCSAETVDLIPLFDLGQHVVSGEWDVVDGEIVNVGDPAARISFPYRPPLEYDYTVDFTLTSGSDPWHNIAQLASRGDVPFEFSTNAGTGHYSRLEDIDGHSVIGNPTLTRYTFVDGGRYTSVVRVRNDRVTCEINGEVLIDYETDYSDLSRNGKWTMPDQLNIGLGGYGGPTTFHSVTITPVPEPSTAALLSLGAVGLLVFRGRRRR